MIWGFKSQQLDKIKNHPLFIVQFLCSSSMQQFYCNFYIINYLIFVFKFWIFNWFVLFWILPCQIMTYDSQYYAHTTMTTRLSIICFSKQRLSFIWFKINNTNSCMRWSQCEICLIFGLNSLIIETFLINKYAHDQMVSYKSD